MPTKLFCILIYFILLNQSVAVAQLYTRRSYHDAEKKYIKEIYQVNDTVRNILHGRYISYHLSGTPESKGQFTNNETTGVWEFYYETGNIKMRGILRQNSNYGLWEYFFENGQKSMEGTINGKTREGEWRMYYENGQLKENGNYKAGKHEGLWKTYYEDGILKSEIDFTDDFGRLIEYYHSGKVFGEGPRKGTKNHGLWRYYAEDGTLESEGEYLQGKKQGEWKQYFSSGKLQAKGIYADDLPIGIWEFYYENGNVHRKGNFEHGVKNGLWVSYLDNGQLHTQTELIKGNGLFTEFHANGQIKAVGNVVQDKREGKWEFFYDTGKKEGDCLYEQGLGTYYGYFTDGVLQTKGPMENDKKVGTWEIYERDGTLSGYYKPFYDEKQNAAEMERLARKNYGRTNASRTKGLSYFDPRINEFKGVIFAANPVFVFAGRLPFAIEFYNQERLGHEFEFTAIRDPFFTADEKIAIDKNYERGYSLAIKQKLYNRTKVGLWYFGHEVRFTNLAHFVNVPVPQSPDNVFTINSTQQQFTWGGMLGYRIMKKRNGPGFTLDTFAVCRLGYRNFTLDRDFESKFSSIEQKPFVVNFQIGLNIGHVFSFE